MLYPKEFEKRADASALIADEVLPQAISMARRANRIGNIIQHNDHSVDPEAYFSLADSGNNESADHPLYVKREGQIYPAVFGYQVPAEMIPRVIKPVLRNLPEGEL